MKRQQVVNALALHLVGLRLPHPVRVAIDGIDAAGKTCLADELAQALRRLARPVIRASLDGFHKPRAARYRLGKDSPEGYYLDSFSYDQLHAGLLEPLGPGGSRRYRCAVFDYRADKPLELPEQMADLETILLLDGVFLMRPELADAWDFCIFVEVSFDTSLARALDRDAEQIGGVEAVRQRYHNRYFPAQRSYLQTCHPSQKADVVVFNDDLDHPRLRWSKD